MLLPFLLLSVPVTITPVAAQAAKLECTLVRDLGTGETAAQGNCDHRVSPASTFKLALAVMGFDSGLLSGPHIPSWAWSEEFAAPRRDQRTVEPISWLKESVVWFSRKLALQLGYDAFSSYVDAFKYGNGDLSGDPGENNGLSNAWISSSLQISPAEQADFLERFIGGALPASAQAQKAARLIVPAFDAGEWQLYGKTGSGWMRNDDGRIDNSQPFGWFVGWAEKDSDRILFVRMRVQDHAANKALGLQLREEVIAAFEDNSIVVSGASNLQNNP